MRIRSVFLLALGLVALPGLTNLSSTALQEWHHWTSADVAVRVAAAMGRVMHAYEKLTVERGVLTTALLAPGADSAAVRQAASETAAEMALAEQALTAAGQPADWLRGVAAEADEIARGMPGMLAKPSAERDPAARNALVKRMIRLNGVLQDITDQLGRQARLADPAVGALAAVALEVMQARDLAGVRSSLLLAWLGGDPAAQPMQDSLADLTSRIDQSWEALQHDVAGLGDPPNLHAAIAATRERFFVKYEPAFRAIIAAARGGAARPMTVPQYRAASVPALADLLVGRDAAIGDAVALGQARAAVAWRGLLIAVVMLGGMLAICVGATVTLLRQLISPMQLLTATLSRIAEGELETAVPGRDRTDELGGMAKAVEVLRERSRQARELDRAAAAATEEKLRRAREVAGLVQEFETGSQEAVGAVAQAAASLHEVASALRDASSGSAGQAGVIADHAQLANSSVNNLAAATEQLSASIGEIARRIGEVARSVDGAATEARGSATQIEALAEAGIRIGNVVQLIEGIAGQTNLLALNATIEAARAGDAGKGFAVVAQEVKNLAAQTAKATGEVATQIGILQSRTDDAVQAIRRVSGTVETVTGLTSGIAAAIEQQRSATAEIARNVQDAAAATAGVTGGIEQVRSRTAETDASAGGLFGVAEQVRADLAGLQAQITTFIGGVRNAA